MTDSPDSNSPRTVTVRPATGEDIDQLVRVSRSADTAFHAAGLDLPPDDPEEEFRSSEWLLVAEVAVDGTARVAGFATLLDIGGGQAHLAGLGVHVDHMRRGVGTTLLDAARSQARDRGYAWLTLTTFRDLPFNAPWYRRRGFSVVDSVSLTPELAERFRLEDEGSGHAAPRVAMRRALR
ncbi:GNAT family N-acetyltransferase [Spiractinospora alimapuensis]|uniref:GNAT family N-acetyltransferase n=1 Tax=Spiractinospora alimapuensis TaxID=2820884 RepID=UPI001F4211B7|nr:GNAT family N-acetyltransferase [Spiractinospora alimapuensis]QVQ50317.1 GNAT family N-acetyltransferase [Spiractinospora alimapuensis]